MNIGGLSLHEYCIATWCFIE